MMANEEIDYKLVAEQLRTGKPLFGKDGRRSFLHVRHEAPTQHVGTDRQHYHQLGYCRF